MVRGIAEDDRVARRRRIGARVIRIARIGRERVGPAPRRVAREGAVVIGLEELHAGFQAVLAVPRRNEVAQRPVDLRVELRPPLRRVGG